jgi:hypothetical protein
MSDAVDYTQNTSPALTDELIGIDAPAGSWALNRFPISNIIALVGGIDGALADGEYSASELIININGGETIAQWELVRYSVSDLEWMLADAVDEAPAWGIAVAATSDGASASIMSKGMVRYDTWNWTPNAVLYLSETPGGLTETAPSTATYTVQPVGRAITADIVYFNFNPITGFGVI